VTAVSKIHTAFLASLASLATLVLFVGVAFAGPEDDAASLFQKGATALRDGSLNEAVEIFEALADRGFVHPDASFDRSLSYLARVRAGAERPGDLGRAAAALEETLLLRPEDRDAEVALDLVRAEVAHRRSRSGSSTEVDARPTLERAVIGVASERTWGIFAVLASLVLTAGLAGRFRVARSEVESSESAHESAIQLASIIAIPIGALCLIAFAGLAFGARHFRLTTSEGVIVVPEAHLVDEKGVLSSRAAIPEAARVELSEQRGSLVHVRWGSVEGWTQSDAVRRLAR
jgi:hypothetical protein